MVLGKRGDDVVDDSSSTTSIPAGTLVFKVRWPHRCRGDTCRWFCTNTHIVTRQVLHARGAPGTGVVVHYGSFGLVGDGGLVTDLSDAPVADIALADTAATFAAGDVVTQLVSRAVRMNNARCHSAGHLLDMVRSHGRCVGTVVVV